VEEDDVLAQRQHLLAPRHPIAQRAGAGARLRLIGHRRGRHGACIIKTNIRVASGAGGTEAA
jgi:hypothetical protein